MDIHGNYKQVCIALGFCVYLPEGIYTAAPRTLPRIFAKQRNPDIPHAIYPYGTTYAMTRDIFDMPLFRNCDRVTAENILGSIPEKFATYRKGDFIAMQGYACNSLYLLGEGSVYARMVSEEGKEFILDTLYAPEALASAFVFSTDRIFPVTIIASADCGIWKINRDSLKKLLLGDREILSNYLKIISDHSMFLSRRLSEFALQTLSSRIISYVTRNGHIDNLQEAAFILGVARPSLSRAISQLVSQGILDKSENSYVLNDNK